MSIAQEEQRVRELGMRIEIRKMNALLSQFDRQLVDAEKLLGLVIN